jgi:hypothetical protein
MNAKTPRKRAEQKMEMRPQISQISQIEKVRLAVLVHL